MIETATSEEPGNHYIQPNSARLDPLDQMVDAKTLLELLWQTDSRPCLRWLRKQQNQRSIPSIRRGRRVWFIPREVLKALSSAPILRKGMGINRQK
jgi:hypothetical protein